jgi:hypothetical protein
MCRTFIFNRLEDKSGVSGVGKVAEGCVFDSGECVVHWLGTKGSINIYHNFNDLIEIHGHGGKTEILFDDDKRDMKKDGN